MTNCLLSSSSFSDESHKIRPHNKTRPIGLKTFCYFHRIYGRKCIHRPEFECLISVSPSPTTLGTPLPSVSRITPMGGSRYLLLRASVAISRLLLSFLGGAMFTAVNQTNERSLNKRADTRKMLLPGRRRRTAGAPRETLSGLPVCSCSAHPNVPLWSFEIRTLCTLLSGST